MIEPVSQRGDADLAQSIGSEVLYQLKFVPLEMAGSELLIAASRDDEDYKLSVRAVTRKQTIRIVKWADVDILRELRSLFGSSPADFSFRSHDTDSRTTRQFLFDMIDEALRQHASDIHFETRPDGRAVASFRIDRALLDQCELTEEQLRAILNVIEQESKAQEGDPLADGSWTFEGSAQRTIDIRVQFLPSKRGRESTLRLVGSAMRLFKLEHLSIPKGAHDVLVQSLMNPHGLHCTAGPTGAGKTTTQAAIIQFLRELYHKRRQRAKIITAEKPVEIAFPDVTQIEIDEARGITFPSVTRAFVRSDADVMVIGEVNDKETVDAACNAALIGRQVLASIHSLDAPTAIERFKVLGADMTTLSMVLRSIIAQRLIKRLCRFCREQRMATKDELDVFHEAGFDKDQTPQYVHERGKGCPECRHWGYNGVVPIFEIIIIGEQMRTAIREGAPLEDLRDIAISQRMKYLPMTQVALTAVRLGECSMEDAREAVFVF